MYKKINKFTINHNSGMLKYQCNGSGSKKKERLIFHDKQEKKRMLKAL